VEEALQAAGARLLPARVARQGVRVSALAGKERDDGVRTAG